MGTNGLLWGIGTALDKGLDAYSSAKDRMLKEAQVEEESRQKRDALARQLTQDKRQEQKDMAGLIHQGYKAVPEGQDVPQGMLGLDVGGNKFAYNEKDFVTPRENAELIAGRDATRAQATSENRNFQQTAEMRKEYGGLPTTKDTQQVVNAYSKILKASEDESPAADLSLIYGIMRMQDPSSTVRESEFGLAASSGSFGDKIKNYYEQAATGKRLQPSQRQDLVNQANKIYSAQMETQKALEGQYSSKASGMGLSPEHVITDFSAGLGNKKPGLLKPAAPNLSPEDAEALQWAQANPNDSRAAKILQRLGK